MRFQSWCRITWCYHILFAVAVTWPVQALINTPQPFILGLPAQMVWVATWVLGSLAVLWRLDAAKGRDRDAPAMEAGTPAHRIGSPTHPSGS